MTSAVQPVQVGDSAKEGPNKILLALLGVLVAAALFMFVVKPLLLDSKPSAPAQAPATTSAPSGAGAGSDSAAKGSLKMSPGGSVVPGAPGTTGESGDGAAAVPAAPTTDALPQVPPQYASQARDPFAPLVQTSGSSQNSSTSKTK